MSAPVNRVRLSDSTRRAGFVALVRSPEAYALLSDPNAFTLLALIAMRARFSQSKSAGLERGQMVMGRESTARELGLKQGAIREATKRLISASYIAVRATNRGSIVTLLNSEVFDICYHNNTASRATNQSTATQPTGSQQTATNEEGKKETKKTIQGAEASVAFPDSLNSPSFKQAWETWMAYRREKHLRPWTSLTVTTKISELAALGETQAIAAIHHSIGNGWQSIYPANQDNKTNKTPKAPLFR